jgi:hypothetical protein
MPDERPTRIRINSDQVKSLEKAQEINILIEAYKANPSEEYSDNYLSKAIDILKKEEPASIATIKAALDIKDDLTQKVFQAVENEQKKFKGGVGSLISSLMYRKAPIADTIGGPPIADKTPTAQDTPGGATKSTR